MPQNETNDFMLPDSYDAVPSATGKLKVIVSAGDFAVPIENAYVVVTRTERGKTHLYHILTTDRSGETPTVELPTVSEALSEAPVNGVSPPYISYTINTYLKGFYEVQNNDVPIFAEITSVQPVRLIPLPFLGERSKLAFNEEEPDL